MVTITLTVFFEDPFWVGVAERQAGGALQAARHVFGAEPSPGEVLEFVQKQLGPLLDRPGAAIAVAPPPARAEPQARRPRRCPRSGRARCVDSVAAGIAAAARTA